MGGDTGVVSGVRYVLGPIIGVGSFGAIHQATDLVTGEIVAAKLELKDRAEHPQLLHEYAVYQSLQTGVGFPNVTHFSSSLNESHHVMIMDRLGRNLEELFNLCSRKFSLKTILQLAIQLIDRVEFLHGNRYIHRDIKPSNFLIGANQRDSHVIYMIDLGLSKRFQDPKTQLHIPYRTGKKLTGTPRYASVHTHNGEEQSRRDDLLSLGYMLIYFSKGELPWQGLKARTKQEKYDKIGAIKSLMSLESLCDNLPREFLNYMKIYSMIS
eukprot:TRINITY_DN9296_c0_g1_i1.p1 TRINITY_DN9296_c0_g1~~TRINITY_DN9296_c0_g1_i1.p1  ORF type:complete len:268 (+),score=47.81 TRINITY_DN9296_c0_g1_i1:190-993(+)